MSIRRILKLNPRQIANTIRLRFGSAHGTTCSHDPSSIMVFITNRCNFKCNTCPFTQASPWSPPPEVPDISVGLFEQILDQYRGATMVGLVGGEPLLHPDLETLISIAAKRKMTVNLSTNGSLLTETRIRNLLSLPLGYLNISLDAVDASEFFRLRGGSAATYEQVKSNAALLNRIRKSTRSPVSFYLSFVTDTVNLRRIPETVEVARQLGADTVFCQSVLAYNCSTVTSGDTLLMDEPDNRRYLESLTMPRDIKLVLPRLVPLPDEAGCTCISCIHPFDLLTVDGAGNLSPCCVIPPHPRFGNVAGNLSAWRSCEPMQRIRREMLDEQQASEIICTQCWERYSLRDRRQ